jgi:serine/threonine-protein kinase
VPAKALAQFSDDTSTSKIEFIDPLVGQIFEDRYKILSILGEGGMGTVYKATHVHMDKLLAIKTLIAGAVNDDKSFERFRKEAKAAASLNHINTISVSDFGRSKDGIAFLVMEFLDGKTLEDVLLELDEPLSLQRFQRIFTQICAGMEHAHKKGIVHRDLKPSNLMIIDSDDEEDLVKIVDFGLAKFCEEEGEKLTKTGVVIGSPQFMSPEQCCGDQLDIRSDIYSLGCIMYLALAGQVPLKGANNRSTISKHVSVLPTPISQLAPQVKIPAQLDLLIMQTLEKDPAKRPQSMAELGRRIKEVTI